jgi:hypothetical protein
VDGNLFVDCHAGISFSRWGAKRWLESVQRFASQAAEPLYASRYPDLAGLKEGMDVNLLTRNLFVRCGSVFLRDGGVERTALNALADGAVTAQTASSNDPQLQRTLFEPIPLDEIGPYNDSFGR